MFARTLATLSLLVCLALPGVAATVSIDSSPLAMGYVFAFEGSYPDLDNPGEVISGVAMFDTTSGTFFYWFQTNWFGYYTYEGYEDFQFYETNQQVDALAPGGPLEVAMNDYFLLHGNFEGFDPNTVDPLANN